MLINSKNSALLQTARANIYNSEIRWYSIAVTKGATSQRIYRRLNLPVNDQDTLLIKTFGETSAKLRRCDITQVAVETINSMKIYVKAYAVPLICTAPISNQVIEFTQVNYNVWS